MEIIPKLGYRPGANTSSQCIVVLKSSAIYNLLELIKTLTPFDDLIVIHFS